jgi:Restriction endonuclease
LTNLTRRAHRVTPQEYIFAVKACPRVVWVKSTWQKELCRGHAIRREDNWIIVISDDDLSCKVRMRWYAEKTTDASHLFVSPFSYQGHSNREHERCCFFGQIPSEELLRAYFLSKHGNPTGLNWLFPRRALNLATVEWVEEQARKEYAQKEAARQAAGQAAHEAEMRKRSYWEFLDGYAFERATAEVLCKYRFNAVVTPGSGDGGIDIEVTRNGLKGVVQCKAHVSCIGPHVVRDLYGVIHHSRASFGVIVSRGGFTKGAIDFARNKPIHLLDTDDLIAMQEGRDVLAAAFGASSSDES